jgi:hypothetical protein
MAPRPAYYLKLDGKELGPFSRAEVRRLLARGELKPDDLARTDQAPACLPVATLLDPATERQLALLQSLSVDVPPNLCKAAASNLISATYARRWQGDPITEAQMGRLRRYGIHHTAETTKGEAARLIDAWLKAHPNAEARHQRQKADRARGRQFLTVGLAALGAVVGTVLGASFGGVGALAGLVVGAAVGFQQGTAAARRFGLFSK